LVLAAVDVEKREIAEVRTRDDGLVGGEEGLERRTSPTAVVDEGIGVVGDADGGSRERTAPSIGSDGSSGPLSRPSNTGTSPIGGPLRTSAARSSRCRYA
jgi:hypothetical protein